MAAKPTHIVDASALIAYFKGEAGHERFAELLRDEGNIPAIHIVNLCEVYYGVRMGRCGLRRLGQRRTRFLGFSRRLTRNSLSEWGVGR